MQPIVRQSVSDLVVDNLEKLITSGQFQIGDHIPTEKSFCDMLHVSRTTIREALRMLKAMGYIEIVPGKGSFVARITRSDKEDYLDWFGRRGIEYTDFMEVRLMLEPWAVALAVERATDKEIAELEKIYTKFVYAYSLHDHVGLVNCDELFHAQIFKMCKNPLLASINDKITEYFIEFRVKVYHNDSGMSNAIEPHKRILEAIKNHDAVTAQAEMLRHVQEIKRDITSVIEQYATKE
jgi:GntR family transcriptional repressor for pyruvate dehydrogenase complex